MEKGQGEAKERAIERIGERKSFGGNQGSRGTHYWLDAALRAVPLTKRGTMKAKLPCEWWTVITRPARLDSGSPEPKNFR